MVRYFARKRLSIDDVVAQRRTSKTPETVVCLTPIISPITIPGVYRTPQLLLKSIADYVDGFFRSGVWIKTQPTETCRSARGVCNVAFGLSNQCYEVGDLLGLGNLRAAKLVQDSAIGSINLILLDEDSVTLAQLFVLFMKMFEDGQHKIALAVFEAIADIGTSTLGQQHPLPRVAGFLLRLDSSDIAEVSAKCLQAFNDQYEDVLGPMHTTSLSIRLLERRTTDGNFGDLLRRCQSDLGMSDARTINVYLRLLQKLFDSGDYGRCARECDKMLNHTHRIQNSIFPANVRADALEVLAHCDMMSSNRDLAIVHLREAIDIRISVFGSLDGLARRWLVQLQDWLTLYGREEEIAEAQRWWDLMWQAEVASQERAIALLQRSEPYNLATPMVYKQAG